MSEYSPEQESKGDNLQPLVLEEPPTEETESTEEPGVAGDPDHGLPGEAEPMPQDDAGVEDTAADAEADDTDG